MGMFRVGLFLISQEFFEFRLVASPARPITCVTCIREAGGGCICFGIGLVLLIDVCEWGVVDIEVFLEGESDDCMGG